MDSTLQELSNGTKNTKIRVRMTKLWSYKVGAKTGDCSNVATLQKRSIPTSRRSRFVLGGFLVHFEPIMEGFKAQTEGIEEEEDLRQILELFEGEKPSLRVKTP